MPRVSKPDLCMFCTDEAPCERHAPKVKAPPKPRAPRKQATAAPIAESKTGSISELQEGAREKADVTAAMRAASTVKHTGRTIKEDHDAQDEIAAILADPEFTAAIQALAPIIHPTETRRFERVLDHRPDGRARAAAWRSRIK